jgi:D-alanine-D-alanine ligase
MKVAVLCGGTSAEREVSLRSGRNVHAALIRKGWDADLLEISSFDGLPKRLAPYALVFNILHGGPGEDGTIQLLLDLMGKPYVGSGPLASALAMDKIEAKKAFQGKGLPTPPWVHVPAGDLESFVAKARALGFPMVLKPRREGSSVGVRLVHAEEELLARGPGTGPKFRRIFRGKVHSRTGNHRGHFGAGWSRSPAPGGAPAKARIL